MNQEQKIAIDGRTYKIHLRQEVSAGPEGVAIVQPSHNAPDLTELSVRSLQRFTKRPHEIWVVDNASDAKTRRRIEALSGVNVILNRTPAWRSRWPWGRLTPWWKVPYAGSYANGVALELAARSVRTRYMFVMHNDAVVCHEGWLDHLLSKMNERVRGVGMTQDSKGVHAMRQSGFLFDFSLFRPLGMNFLPDMPRYDAGDLVSIRLREAGYGEHICLNTFNDPGAADLLAPGHPLRDLPCDRTFDDDGNVIFMHMGRGTTKTQGAYNKPDKVYPAQWREIARAHLLGPTAAP